MKQVLDANLINSKLNKDPFEHYMFYLFDKKLNDELIIF